MKAGELIEVRDEIALGLDEVADLAAQWSRHRSNGRMPRVLRVAMLAAMKDVIAQLDFPLYPGHADGR